MSAPGGDKNNDSKHFGTVVFSPSELTASPP